MTAAVISRVLVSTRIDTVPSFSGRLYGTAHLAGSPSIPVKRRVQLTESAINGHGLVFPVDGTKSTWVWSDENGEWEARYLDPSKKYHIIAYDHTGQYDPVIKMNLVPTVD